MLKTLKSFFNYGAESVIHFSSNAYDIGYKDAKQGGADEKTCHECGIFQQLCTFVSVYKKDLGKHPSFSEVDTNNPESYIHEVIPFIMLSGEAGKMAMAWYQAWLIFGYDMKHIPIAKLIAFIVIGIKKADETFEKNEMDSFILQLPAWLELADLGHEEF